MPGRIAALTALSATALVIVCVPRAPPAAAYRTRRGDLPAPRTPGGAATTAPPSPAPARFFLATPEESFWVSRGEGTDRVIADGSRLEVSPTGEVTGAAWDLDLSARGEPLVGAFAVPSRLGGGFVAWTRARVFRARDFTGPLQPVALDAAGELVVRGVRAGLASIIVVTDAGPRELAAGSVRLTPLREPGILDLAAVSPQRAAKLDVFGRLSLTADGGTTWLDLTPATGLGVRQLVVGEGELFFDSGQGRFLVGPGGKLDLADPPSRSSAYEQPRAFQTAWKNAHAADHEGWPWGLRETTPLSVAVAAGAPIGDGTAFGFVQGTVVRVDLATGALLSVATDWIPQSLACQPVRAPDGVLFACVWERSQGYGGYVLRSVAGAPPVVEKAFSDDGAFVADEEGALGYVGSCKAELRYVDPNDPGRFDGTGADAPIKPVLCVRRGPGEWVERRVEVGEGATLLAWAPRLDGTAAALVLSGDPLPPPAGERRVVEQGGVRLVRVYPEIPGWSWKRAALPERYGLSGDVERRFTAHADGTIDGWLGPGSESSDPVALGVTLDPDGLPILHEVAPEAMMTITGGAFAVALARDGALFESTDHGHTWRPGGRWPAAPAVPASTSCSALGCAAGAIVRSGWGRSALGPRISTEPFAPADPTPLPRLACAPRGGPIPLAAPPLAPAGARQTLSTAWGDTLEIVRDAAAPEAPPPSSPPTPPSPTTAPSATSATPHAPGSAAVSAAAGASRKPPRASPAVLRTHTLVMRQPLAPFAPPRRLNATDGGWSSHQRRTLVVPLLTPSGDVDLLLAGDQTELLVSGDRVTATPAFDSRRYFYGDATFTGLTLPGSRALVLAEVRRRLALEDHGPGVPAPPLLLGLERDRTRRRPLALARRDDGAVGVLVFDGGAPATVGVAVIDRLAAGARPASRLAPWSSVLTADDPRCQRGADPSAWEALLVIDPATWLTLDAAALPGITLARQGLLHVRWGTERVCLLGMDAAVADAQRRGETHRAWSVVARWTGDRDRGAVLRTADLRQELSCRIEPAAPGVWGPPSSRPARSTP